MHHYQNKEIKILEDGTKVVRKVHIKGKKGHKSVSNYKHNKHVFTVKKCLKNKEISLIKNGIKGMFTKRQTMISNFSLDIFCAILKYFIF
jgi:hypothetical protein